MRELRNRARKVSPDTPQYRCDHVKVSNLRVGQQFRQLPMFMTAREIRNQYQALDEDRDEILGESSERLEDDEELFDRKYTEASEEPRVWAGNKGRWVATGEPSLAEQIRNEGVTNPISLQADHKRTGYRNMPEILGGHHRVAVMSQHRPDNLMPVEHFDSYIEAQRSLGDRY